MSTDIEASPANRLPEVDSLPDGFVESSGDADYKESFIDHDQPPPKSAQLGAAAGGEQAVDPGGSLEGKGDLGQSGDSAVAGDAILPHSGDEPLKESKSPEGTEGRLELHTNNTKGRCTAEFSDHLKKQKPESTEGKRKVAKRSVKSEKELLEFTLKYQKVIAERDAAVAVRERLESLCRELQRQNKMLMDECQRVSTEGQTMRLELSTKFNDAIKDVSVKLEEQKNDSLSQLKENENLRNKLKHLADQYTLSEQQFTQKLKQKMLELQLADLKLQQQKERSAQEQTQMKLYVEQVTQLLSTEKDLRAQLAADGEKFQQFQEALLKSNEVFETFKQEMEKMSKLTKDLKKENEFMKNKCENSDIAIVKLIEEREHMKKQLEKVKNQKEKLESLCRSLQAERKQNLVESTSAESNPMQVKAECSDESS